MRRRKRRKEPVMGTTAASHRCCHERIAQKHPQLHPFLISVKEKKSRQKKTQQNYL